MSGLKGKAANGGGQLLHQTEPAPPSPDALRFLGILERWAGPEAPNGAAWRIQPRVDLEWYRREIVEGSLAQGLNMLEVLAGWDEFLEMIVRGQKQCRFPTNFKNSLRNQVALWRQRMVEGRLRPPGATAMGAVGGTRASGLGGTEGSSVGTSSPISELRRGHRGGRDHEGREVRFFTVRPNGVIVTGRGVRRMPLAGARRRSRCQPI